MSRYNSKFPFLAGNRGLTMQEASWVYQLTPDPPPMENTNDYIITAIEKHDFQYFLFFLHHHEGRLNGRVARFMLREGLDRYDPERFLDYKQNCVLARLKCLEHYDPNRGADFLTYTHHPIDNALLHSRMMEETGSFSSLDEYKNVRGIAWLYNKSVEAEKAIAGFSERSGCSAETAEKYLSLAQVNRSWVPLYAAVQDGDGEETGEDMTRDDSWNYTALLWNGIQADTVRTAFEKLTYRERCLLEERNAICMTCGRVSPLSQRKSFEDLAVMFEGSGANGAERAYRRAVEKLTVLLVETGLFHAVRLKQNSIKRIKKKITAAVFEYQADCDGKWGKIQFDFESGTVEIVGLAEWDTIKSKTFARQAISYILNCDPGKLPKHSLVAFD